MIRISMPSPLHVGAIRDLVNGEIDDINGGVISYGGRDLDVDEINLLTEVIDALNEATLE